METSGFLALVILILAGSARQWWRLLRGTKSIVSHEAEFVPLSAVQRETKDDASGASYGWDNGYLGASFNAVPLGRWPAADFGGKQNNHLMSPRVSDEA